MTRPAILQIKQGISRGNENVCLFHVKKNMREDQHNSFVGIDLYHARDATFLAFCAQIAFYLTCFARHTGGCSE